LTLIFELAEPYPMTETARGEVLDRVYETVGDRRDVDRDRKVEWALQAGGEVVRA
jgi:hypothetical protein